MSSGIDKEFVRAHYQRMTDQEIVRVLTNDLKGLTADAQKIVKYEITRRGLDPAISKAIDAQQPVYEPPEKVFDPNSCPVEEPTRVWMEQSFLKLLNFFGEAETLARTVLTPERKHFGIKYDGSERSALETLAIVARQMEVDPADVELDFYDDHLSQITEGSPGGLYGGRGENDKFEISLVRRKLDNPEGMVATLAHEIAHIKLLGENRIEENDEKLTDMTTVFFGLGVFNANAAFQTWTDSKYNGWSSSGYLTQMEWGYALALFAYIRQEAKPEWVEHLSKNVKADFLQGWNFIIANEEIIFQ